MSAEPEISVTPSAPRWVPPPAPEPRRTRSWTTRHLILGTLVALVLGTALGAGSADQGDEIAQLRADLAVAEGEAGAARAEVGQVRTGTADRMAALEKAAKDAQPKAEAAAKAKVDAENAKRVAELDARSAELDARQAALDGQQADLDAREAAVSRKEEAKRTTQFDDGTHEVGVDIQAGKYKTAGVGGRCYWAKLNRAGGIIDNEFAEGPQTVVIEPTVFTFKSSGCGTWTKTG